MRALIIGGTAEARDLAARMTSLGWSVTTSLPSDRPDQRLPVAAIHMGGFGGPAGLAKWLLADATEVVIDASDPFDERISITAIEAARAIDIPLVWLETPRWTDAARFGGRSNRNAKGAQWQFVDDLAGAAELVADRYHAPLLSLPAHFLSDFAYDDNRRYLIRTDSHLPKAQLPEQAKVLVENVGSVEQERKLLRDYAIDSIVLRNTGRFEEEPLLHAAADLNKPVILVRQPQYSLPRGTIHCKTTVNVINVLRKTSLFGWRKYKF